MEIKKRIIVVAGHYRQYLDWLEENKFSKHNYLYVCEPSQLNGMHNVEVIKIGSYTKNLNWPKIREQLKYATN